MKIFCRRKQITNIHVEALIHFICTSSRHRVEDRIKCLSDISDSISDLTLNVRDIGGCNVLHHIAYYGCCSMKILILNQISDQKRLEEAIVENHNLTRSDVIHMALSRKCGNCDLLLLNRLSFPKLMHALVFSKNLTGTTPVKFVIQQGELKQLLSMLARMPAYIFLKVVETVITEKLTTNVGLEEIPHSPKRLALIDKLSDYFMMSIGSVSNAQTRRGLFFYC